MRRQRIDRPSTNERRTWRCSCTGDHVSVVVNEIAISTRVVQQRARGRRRQANTAGTQRALGGQVGRGVGVRDTGRVATPGQRPELLHLLLRQCRRHGDFSSGTIGARRYGKGRRQPGHRDREEYRIVATRTSSSENPRAMRRRGARRGPRDRESTLIDYRSGSTNSEDWYAHALQNRQGRNVPRVANKTIRGAGGNGTRGRATRRAAVKSGDWRHPAVRCRPRCVRCERR